jgi:cobalt-zinc-cadmium efflux system outer membrane protein
VTQYETAVEQAKLQLGQNKSKVLRLMGRVVAPGLIEFTGDLPQTRQTEGLPELISRAQANRPDLLASRQTQARSQADLKLQLANGKVDYVLGSEYSYQRAFGIGGSSLGFGISVPVPVFNKNQGEIARAQRESQQSSARIAAMESMVRNEVEMAYREYQTALRILERIEGSLLNRARSVRDTTEYSYRRGEATLVEFLDAQRAFNDSVLTYNAARASLARGIFNLETVSGSGIPGRNK